MSQITCACGCEWEVPGKILAAAFLVKCPMCQKVEVEEVTEFTPESKPVKPKKQKRSEPPRNQVKWTEEIIEDLKNWVSEGLSNKEIADETRKKHGRNTSTFQIANILFRNQIKRGVKKKTEIEPTPHTFDSKKSTHEKTEKKKNQGMSDEDIRILENNYMDLTDEEIRIKIGDETGHFHSVGKIQAFRETNGMIKPESEDDDWEEDD